MITAEYLPSSLEEKAHWQLKNVMTKSEWKLLLEMFQKITKISDQAKVNLFVLSKLSRLADYIEHGRQAQQYFPPFSLLGQILSEVLKK